MTMILDPLRRLPTRQAVGGRPCPGRKRLYCSVPGGTTRREFIDSFEKKNNSSPHAATVDAAWKQSRQELFSNLPVPCKVKMSHSPINESAAIKSQKRLSVIPAKAEIHSFQIVKKAWIPFFRGMTTFRRKIIISLPRQALHWFQS